MKYILTSVDSIQKYRFFDKLNRVLKSYSCEIVFVTIRLSVYLIGRSSGRKIYLVKKIRVQTQLIIIERSSLKLTQV